MSMVVGMCDVAHVVVRYETDLIDEFGETCCGKEFSLWDGVMQRGPMPMFDTIVPVGHRKCGLCPWPPMGTLADPDPPRSKQLEW
jgi:hypothetical protein